MKVFSILLLSLLFFSCMSHGETVIIPVQDLLFSIPDYTAPSFNLNTASAMNGDLPVGTLPKKQKKKDTEKALIALVWDIYPEATSVRIFKGNILIVLPKGEKENGRNSN